MIYPEAGTALPRNIEGIDFQWDAGRRQGEQSFEVEMRTEDVTVRWYTAADHLVRTGRVQECPLVIGCPAEGCGGCAIAACGRRR